MVAAFGWWPSSFTAAEVAAGKVSRSGLQVDGERVYWSESRPGEGGRQVVVGARPGEPPADVSPAGVSVRSRVHEYGGAAVTVTRGTLYYVDQSDQRWYRHSIGREAPAVPLTPAPSEGTTVRYGDGRLTPSSGWLVTVEERIEGAKTDHRLVSVATDGTLRVVSLVEGGDFVSAPRLSPDGRLLAWLTWDHPAMPWDEAELWVAQLDETAEGLRSTGARRLAGGGGSAIGQPLWLRDGSLLFVDDRSGWWLPYRLDGPVGWDRAGCPVVLVDREAEFHGPDWTLGQSTLAELADGSLVGRMHENGRDHLVRLSPPLRGEAGPWAIEVIDQPCVTLAGVASDGDRVFVLGTTPFEAAGVFAVALRSGCPAERVSAEPGSAAVRTSEVARAESVLCRGPEGDVPGLFFPPTNARFVGPAGERPPLVISCHGGPTGAAETGFDPVVQFLTSRGLAVALVDYRGSSGYGRAFRCALRGRWGEADVDDVVAYAEALAAEGRVDRDRMAVRGASAGGLTALGALARSRRFAGAVAWYGVTDLEALAADTHDFESHYLDSLVGPWPEDAHSYRSRSPLNHPDQVTGAVLLLQGEDDPVVPADQSRRFAERLREQGVDCRLVMFAGESHGFRRADTIAACLDAELEFYRSLFARPDPPGGEAARR